MVLFRCARESLPWHARRPVLTALLALLAVGCAANRVTLTPRSGIEQRLLTRSLERAVAQLDLHSFTGKRVALDLYTLSGDQFFAKEYVASLLEARKLEVVPESDADLRLKIFATVLGVDQGQTLFGVPAFVAPVVAFPIPEIALFKWIRNRGHTEIAIFAYDSRTTRLIQVTPSANGRAMFDEYTILLAISFTREDLEDPPRPSDW
jgi:hypothetical protein